MDFQPHPSTHAPQAPQRPHTPAPAAPAKAVDEMFCPSCGKAIKKEALFCVNCGVQVGHLAHAPGHGPATAGAPQPRDKTTAVLLAVFLGLWTWVYTYQKDAWKFWLNLILTILTLSLWGFVAWIWGIIDVCVKPESYYRNYPNE